MDLTSTSTHSVILDLDYKSNASPKGILPIVETVLKMTFLPAISHFTYIVAIRAQHCGIHIHLPEFKIGHDDYILLCETLQQKFRQALIGNETHQLDILMNAMLPGAAKPDTAPYSPLNLMYVDEQNTFNLTVQRFEEEYPSLKKSFAKRKSNENSLFRSLLKLNSRRMLQSELKHLMMPVIDARTDAPTHTLLYTTKISKTPNKSSDWRDVATFTYKKTREEGFISKGKKLIFHSDNAMKVYYHLKLNACNMVELVTNNHAIKRWFERFGRVSTLSDAHIPDLFRDLHETLQFEHMNLADNPNPIKTVMQYKDGYYFLPVFYAFCHHYQLAPEPMAQQLLPLLDHAYHPLLEKLCAVPKQNVQFTTREMSLNTIHFCAI